MATATFTPRGLKIRLSPTCSFSLMSNLYPKVKPAELLYATEILDTLAGTICFIIGVICFLLKLQPVAIGFAVFSACFVYLIIKYTPITILIILPPLGLFLRLFSRIQGWGVLTITIVALGYYMVGWQGIAGYFCGRVCGFLVSYYFDSFQRKEFHEKTGMIITGAEESFFRAYMLYAMKMNMDPDIGVNLEEIDEDKLKELIDDYCLEYPGACYKMEVA